jgi:hypothetical protein
MIGSDRAVNQTNGNLGNAGSDSHQGGKACHFQRICSNNFPHPFPVSAAVDQPFVFMLTAHFL